MSDTASLDRRREEWIATVNARDGDGYAEMFAPDGVWIPPGQAGVQGREPIRAWLRPFFARFEYDFSVEQPRARIAGPWAIETGTFVSRLRAVATGDVGTHSGRYLILWRLEEDGLWYIERYVDVT